MSMYDFSVYLRSAVFYVVLFVFTIVFTSTCTIIGPALPYKVRFRVIIQGYTKFVTEWLRICCKVDYRLEGLEHIPDQPCVIVSKHQSTWETFFLQTLFAPQTQVIKKELLAIPFFGWAFSLVQPIAIDRSNRKEAMKQVLEQGAEKLNNNVWVLVFPEGTRMNPGKTRPFSKGAAALAKHASRPMLPVAHNAGEHWPNDGYLKYPGTIRVVFGPPIHTQNKSVDELTRDAENWINNTVDEISAHQHETDILSITP